MGFRAKCGRRRCSLRERHNHSHDRNNDGSGGQPLFHADEFVVGFSAKPVQKPMDCPRRIGFIYCTGGDCIRPVPSVDFRDGTASSVGSPLPSPVDPCYPSGGRAEKGVGAHVTFAARSFRVLNSVSAASRKPLCGNEGSWFCLC